MKISKSGRTLISYLFHNLYIILPVLLICIGQLFSQDRTELNSDWYCKNVIEVTISGEELTKEDGFEVKDWMPATVPGTVLTALLDNAKIPDPFYGMNNEHIQDIHDVGRDHYTYWFYKDFNLKEIGRGEQYHLHFRGVNYGCEVFLNGQKLNKATHYGMFIRQSYNITPYVKSGKNRLAVLVLPPDPVGNPNGGQGGDGVIARNVMHQYVAGWDWIQPVRDRNTGIWDKVFLEKTGSINLRHPYIVTRVPGKRYPGIQQKPCFLSVSVAVKNETGKTEKVKLYSQVNEQTIDTTIHLLPYENRRIDIRPITLNNTELWWPNGYGEQCLYNLQLGVETESGISDTETVPFGVREITIEWNEKTQSTQVLINGQKIFIKGGNWIISDAMLRFSEERYDAEIRMHQQMNLNCIRIWGGAITERPEFYTACDKYGLLVMQDFWVSGDCNGRWLDPRKKEDQWTRRQYPDDHDLFLRSAADQVKMIRNHPSLAFWCGGNEISPPKTILKALKDSLKTLDGTRWFVESSTSDSMSFNFIGGNGDGPYSIQPLEYFFEHQSFPFNSEVGSVGMPDYEGLLRYIPEEAMIIPGTYDPGEETGERRRNKVHPVWHYHKYHHYGDFIKNYGTPADISDYAFKAQLVNYNQYRALIEGFSAHMWEWYTGVIIWKTQNPWTAMRGQMYDYYLDPNAGLFGLKHASKPLHIYFDPVEEQVLITNNTFEALNDIMIQVTCLDMKGNANVIYQELVSINPTTTKRYGWIGRRIKRLGHDEGVFLSIKLFDYEQSLLDENFYWLPDENGVFSGLQNLKPVNLTATAFQADDGEIEIKIKNPSEQNPVSFFNRISLVDKQTGKRVLPVFYSDNYISILPREEQTIRINVNDLVISENHIIRITGWNTVSMDIDISL